MNQNNWVASLKELLVKNSLIYAYVDAQNSSDPRRTRLWVLQELVRRIFLKRESRCPTMLLSYPRSGNHLVRYVVEHCSRRPTLGWGDKENLLVPRSLHDKPIFLRDRNIEITNAKPILVKRHEPDYEPKRLILLVRNPVEAILSHKGRGLVEIPDSELLEQAEKFMDNCRFFANFPDQDRMIIFLEDALRDPLPIFSRLLEFLDIDNFQEKIRNVTGRLDDAKNVLQREANPELTTKIRKELSASRNFLEKYFQLNSQELEAIGINYQFLSEK